MQLSNGDRIADGRDGSSTISISPLDDAPGLEIFDPIERHRCALHTAERPSPRDAATDVFTFPVDAAVEIRTSAVELPMAVGAYVRNDDGEVVAEAQHFALAELPADDYSIELTTQVKMYLRVEGEVAITSDFERTRIEFGEETRVLVGARSRHDRPAATITTTRDPADLMTAVSHLSSALKTTSPERSYPTLRGHPPTLELGESLEIPDRLERPETGVTLELPPDYEHVLVAAPLAYYLGAEVVPGDVPRLVTDDGFVHDLDGYRGFEAEVERVLKQVFLLDCVVRTEGFYDVELRERTAIEADLDLGVSLAALYELPLAAQLETYLSVPYAVVEEHVPEWKLTTHVSPEADSVELLPFLVDDLAIIRTPKAREATGSAAQLAAVNDFLRDEDDFTRSASESATPGPVTLRPETTNSLEQAWIGNGAPIGASKPTVESFRNRLDRTPSDGDIGITVVCNDAEMAEERDVVSDVYGSRDDLPFDVSIHRELTTAELRDLLASEIDFLHYIGHIDDEGFQCADGRLSTGDLGYVGVDAFLLNACQSYEQGFDLIEAGAIGGVVTLRDVVNSGAVKIGRTLSRLLNCGFSLRAALGVASDESVIGSQYVVVGDGGFAVVQAESGTPHIYEIARVGEEFEITIHAYPTSDRGMGTVILPVVEQEGCYTLASGSCYSMTVSESELRRSLDAEVIPTLVDGCLRWSNELVIADI